MPICRRARLAAPFITLLLAGSASAQAQAAVTFKPVADTYSKASSPTRNYGSDRRVRLDGSPVARTYLRFEVQNLSGAVTRAQLRLYAESSASSAGVDLRPVASTGWGERSLNYRNAPAAGSSVFRTGAFSSGQWVTLDATRIVKGNGAVSVAVTTTSSGARAFASRENATRAPQLVVEQAAAETARLPEATPAPAPAPSATPAPDPAPAPAPSATPTPTPTPTLAPEAAPAPTPEAAPAPTPEAAPAPTPEAAPVKSQLRGAQTHPLWSGSSIADFDRELDLLRDAGGDVVRMDISWSSLETSGKGQYSSYYVSKIDTFMEHARARGIKVIPVILSTPCWSSTAPADLKLDCTGAYWDRGVTLYPPSSAKDFADISAYVARRWSSYMAALEIWNEPNEFDQNFLKSPDPAAAYAVLLKAAYPAVKAAAPDLPVLAASLSFADGAFLVRLYEQGIKGNFDGVSIHPYNENRDPDILRDASLRKWTYINGVPWIHDIMTAHGDGEKGVWITEVGFSTCNVTTDKWCNTEAMQAEYTADTIRIARSWSYVRAVVVYNLRNKGTDLADRESQFGMVHRDFTPKPAYAAFKAALAGG